MDPYRQPKRALSGGFDIRVFVDDAAFLAIDGFAALLIAVKGDTPSDAPMEHIIHIQRLRVECLTGTEGVTWTLLDGEISPVVVTPVLDMSTAGSEYVFDFGPQGMSLSSDANLAVVSSEEAPTGVSGNIYIEGFQERTHVAF
jgi:hypothetical protein